MTRFKISEKNFVVTGQRWDTHWVKSNSVMKCGWFDVEISGKRYNSSKRQLMVDKVKAHPYLYQYQPFRWQGYLRYDLCCIQSEDIEKYSISRFQLICYQQSFLIWYQHYFFTIKIIIDTWVWRIELKKVNFEKMPIGDGHVINGVKKHEDQIPLLFS